MERAYVWPMTLRLLAVIQALAASAVLLAPATTAATARPAAAHPPIWLKASEQQTLGRVFGGAKPVRTFVIPYPKKIAVVFVFDHVVVCGVCSAPSASQTPRGRVVRVSFDRATHRLGGAKNGWAMQFCDVVNGNPPLGRCLTH
jgi:hypothetical protein